MPDAYPYESHGRTELPSPGRWSLNWATEDVASWYYGDDKTGDATFAHFFDTRTDCYIESGDVRIPIDYDTDADRDDAIAAALREFEPTNG